MGVLFLGIILYSQCAVVSESGERGILTCRPYLAAVSGLHAHACAHIHTHTRILSLMHMSHSHCHVLTQTCLHPYSPTSAHTCTLTWYFAHTLTALVTVPSLASTLTPHTHAHVAHTLLHRVRYLPAYACCMCTQFTSAHGLPDHSVGG